MTTDIQTRWSALQASIEKTKQLEKIYDDLGAEARRVNPTLAGKHIIDYPDEVRQASKVWYNATMADIEEESSIYTDLAGRIYKLENGSYLVPTMDSNYGLSLTEMKDM